MSVEALPIGAAGRTAAPASIETPASWTAAIAALAIMSVSFGAPLIAIVGLRGLVADLGTTRSMVSLCASLSWLGGALGGQIMGPVAQRFGTRATVIFGAAMVAVGLVVSASGGPPALLVGHGLFIGVLGSGAINAPLYVYVCRWFDRRLGSAIAIISSGAFVAGMLWPELFQYCIAHFGWRWTMIGYAGVEVVAIGVGAAVLLRPSPPAAAPRTAHAGIGVGRRVLGLPSWLTTALFLVANFCCCATMSMPQTHLVAFCGDLGIAPATGAAMLSVLLATAFFSRQFWGWAADHYGGLGASLLASAFQAAAIGAFLFTRNEAALFFVSFAFGLGVSGIVPGYIVAIGALFPPSQAAIRVPAQLLFGGLGMAFGSWSAGALYDVYGYYAPGFAVGLGFNIANLAILGTLVILARWHHQRA